MKSHGSKWMFLLLLTIAPVRAAEQSQSLASLHAAIKQFVHERFTDSEDFQVSVAPLDPRLRFPLCTEALEVFVNSGELQAGHNSMGVKCPGTKKWTLFTSVEIVASKQVWVLKKPIRRGEILRRTHLTLAKRNLADLRRGYLLEPDGVVNKEAKYNLARGTAVSLSIFVEPTVVQRGDKVFIEAKTPYFAISMHGIALSDGKKGENIRVKNVDSKRVIQATVVKSGYVSVY